MGDGHFAERKLEIGLLAGFVAEAVCGTDGEHQRLRIAALMVADELSEFFGGELLAARIKEHKAAARRSPAEFQERSFIFKAEPFGLCVLAQALEVFVSEGLDRGAFRLSDPCNRKLHAEKILTAKDAKNAKSNHLTAEIAEAAEKTKSMATRKR